MSSGSGGVDIDTARDVLASHPVELAVLFGSHARGEQSVESDIDIAIAFDETVEDDRQIPARVDLIVDLSDQLETDAIDITDLDTVRPSVGAHALRTGILLVGDDTLREEYLTGYERHLETDTDSHEHRMKRLQNIVDRLEAGR